jgi:hypothetical protein
MKTATYLRFSLLIPFAVWGICLLVIMATSAVSKDQFVPELQENISTGVAVFFSAYVIGIIFWIFPYLLLALILFFSTFISQGRTALKVFALSPLAMTLLTLATVILIDLSSSGTIDQGFSNFILFVVGLVLIWGYICVGIGYGIYRLLQRRGKIRDEESIETTLLPA